MTEMATLTYATTSRTWSSKQHRCTKKACNSCRRRKVKCSSEPICHQCSIHGIACIYSHVSTLPAENTNYSSASLNAGEESQAISAGATNQSQSFCQNHESPFSPLDTLLLKDFLSPNSLDIGLDPLLASLNSSTDFHGLNDTPLQPLPVSRPSEFSQRSHPNPLNHSIDLPNSFGHSPATLMLSKSESIDLLEYFHDEIVILYPFVPYTNLTRLVVLLFDLSIALSAPSAESNCWEDLSDIRVYDLLVLTLACAVASKVNQETNISKEMMRGVLVNLDNKVHSCNIDTKDVAIATMLSVYYFQCDEVELSWRRIGIAAKLCLELGLHKTSRQHKQWESQLFWTVYVLDRRFSFMLKLPYTIQDGDIESHVVVPDKSAPYLTSLTSQVYLAGKIVRCSPIFGEAAYLIDQSTCLFLENQIDQWALTTSSSISFPQESLDVQKPTLKNFKEAFVTICRNQLKISLYKHTLYSAENIIQSPLYSKKAVMCATETVRLCYRLASTTKLYDLQAANCNFFLLSSIATLYLAIKHGPCRFGSSSADATLGLEVLETFCKGGKGTDRLFHRVQTLKDAISKINLPMVNWNTLSETAPGSPNLTTSSANNETVNTKG